MGSATVTSLGVDVAHGGRGLEREGGTGVVLHGSPSCSKKFHDADVACSDAFPGHVHMGQRTFCLKKNILVVMGDNVFVMRTHHKKGSLCWTTCRRFLPKSKWSSANGLLLTILLARGKPTKTKDIVRQQHAVSRAKTRFIAGRIDEQTENCCRYRRSAGYRQGDL
jgi:hypothetical protein